MKVNLEPATGDNEEAKFVRLTLLIEIPTNYPNDLPIVTVKSSRGLSDQTINTIMKDCESKAVSSKGNPMLFELIDVAKELLTSGNLPTGQCAVCLCEFTPEDVFTRTDCYHFFHSKCLASFLSYSKETWKENEGQVNPIEPNKDASVFEPQCPICRFPISFNIDVFMACNLPKDSGTNNPEEDIVEIGEETRQLQKDMAILFDKQKAQGGIIDLELEKSKFNIEIASVPNISTRALVSALSSNPDETTNLPQNPKPTTEKSNKKSLGKYLGSVSLNRNTEVELNEPQAESNEPKGEANSNEAEVKSNEAEVEKVVDNADNPTTEQQNDHKPNQENLTDWKKNLWKRQGNNPSNRDSQYSRNYDRGYKQNWPRNRPNSYRKRDNTQNEENTEPNSVVGKEEKKTDQVQSDSKADDSESKNDSVQNRKQNFKKSRNWHSEDSETKTTQEESAPKPAYKKNNHSRERAPVSKPTYINRSKLESNRYGDAAGATMPDFNDLPQEIDNQPRKKTYRKKNNQRRDTRTPPTEDAEKKELDGATSQVQTEDGQEQSVDKPKKQNFRKKYNQRRDSNRSSPTDNAEENDGQSKERSQRGYYKKRYGQRRDYNRNSQSQEGVVEPIGKDQDESKADPRDKNHRNSECQTDELPKPVNKTGFRKKYQSNRERNYSEASESKADNPTEVSDSKADNPIDDANHQPDRQNYRNARGGSNWQYGPRRYGNRDRNSSEAEDTNQSDQTNTKPDNRNYRNGGSNWKYGPRRYGNKEGNSSEASETKVENAQVEDTSHRDDIEQDRNSRNGGGNWKYGPRRYGNNPNWKYGPSQAPRNYGGYQGPRPNWINRMPRDSDDNGYGNGHQIQESARPESQDIRYKSEATSNPVPIENGGGPSTPEVVFDQHHNPRFPVQKRYNNWSQNRGNRYSDQQDNSGRPQRYNPRQNNYPYSANSQQDSTVKPYNTGHTDARLNDDPNPQASDSKPNARGVKTPIRKVNENFRPPGVPIKGNNTTSLESKPVVETN